MEHPPTNSRRSFLKQLGFAAAAIPASGIPHSREPEQQLPPLPEWRDAPNLDEQVTGLAMQVRRTLTRELETARRSGKTPVILVGDIHNNKMSFLVESVIGLTLGDLQKQSPQRRGVTICTEASSPDGVALDSARFSQHPEMSAMLADKERLFRRGDKAIGMHSLVDALNRAGVANQFMLLGNNEAPSAKPDYYLLSTGEIIRDTTMARVKSGFEHELGVFDRSATSRLEANFPRNSKQTPLVVAGANHLKPIYDKLSQSGNYHVVAFETTKPTDNLHAIVNAEKDAQGKVLLAHKLILAGPEVTHTEVLVNNVNYLKGEKITVDPTIQKAKADFVRSEKVHSVGLKTDVQGTFDGLFTLASTAVASAKSLSQSARER